MRVYTPLARLGKRKGAITPSSNFHLAAEHHVIIELEEDVKATLVKTQATLEEINAVLQRLAGKDKTTSEIITEALNNPVESLESDEPKELSVNIHPAFVEPENTYGHIVYAGDLPSDWNLWHNIKWLENPNKPEGEQLVIRYRADEFCTSWDVMKRLSREPDKSRIGKIRRLLGDKWSNNRRTALNQFAIALASGEIKQPENLENELENNMKAFHEEEDPDSVFKPMLNAYSTRPDPNCGKIEGDLGVM